MHTRTFNYNIKSAIDAAGPTAMQVAIMHMPYMFFLHTH